jgi:deoxyxylulose-5-phosphate synthase
MTILAPSSYQELQQMRHDALEITTGPVAIRYPKTPAPDVDEGEVGVGLSARKVRSGTDVAVLAIGKMLAAATEAAERLAADGIEATVYDVRCAKPLDPAMIVIGGGLADIGAPLLDAVRRAYDEVMVDLAHRSPVTIVLSHHGDRSGTIGAALAVAP